MLAVGLLLVALSYGVELLLVAAATSMLQTYHVTAHVGNIAGGTVV